MTTFYMKRLLALCIVGYVLAACSPSHAKSELVGCQLVKPPTNPTELLQNLLCLTKQGMSLNDDFFIDDQRLWEATGGTSFLRDYSSKGEYSKTIIKNFPPSIIASKAPSDTSQMLISLESDLSAGWEIYILSSYQMGLRYADIEKVFGSRWKNYFPNIPFDAHVSPLKPPTDTYGNKYIRYDLAPDSITHATVRIHFDHQGISDGITFVVGDPHANKPPTTTMDDYKTLAPPPLPLPFKK